MPSPLFVFYKIAEWSVCRHHSKLIFPMLQNAPVNRHHGLPDFSMLQNRSASGHHSSIKFLMRQILLKSCHHCSINRNERLKIKAKSVPNLNATRETATSKKSSFNDGGLSQLFATAAKKYVHDGDNSYCFATVQNFFPDDGKVSHFPNPIQSCLKLPHIKKKNCFTNRQIPYIIVWYELSACAISSIG